MTDEQGSRGGEQVHAGGRGNDPIVAAAPDTYRWRHWQLGGVVQWQNSMGSSLTADNQASFKDAMQMIGTAATTIYAAKAAMAAEITKRVTEGEITIRHGAQLQQQLALAQTDAELQMFLAALPK